MTKEDLELVALILPFWSPEVGESVWAAIDRALPSQPPWPTGLALQHQEAVVWVPGQIVDLGVHWPSSVTVEVWRGGRCVHVVRDLNNRDVLPLAPK